MTRFLVFRHGQSDANLKEYFAGWTDAALTPLGAEQARLAAEYVSRTEKPCCVWTSELTRAYLTGKAFADVCRIPIFRSAALNEIRAGRWEGVPFRDIKKLYMPDYSVWQNDVGNSRCTDGESVRELADRVVKEVLRISSLYPDSTVVIATHATPVMAIEAASKLIPPDRFKDVPWRKNASMSVVECDGKRLYPVRFGVLDHLGEKVSFDSDEV
ncbi:MAG: histidine phosphatase family protein [Clostridia bacterium]|nr:histidine phosphatase family protein [Clostridia bacterium]